MSCSQISGAVQSLQNLQSEVSQDAPELANEFSHLVSIGQGLEAGQPTALQVTNYGNAVKNFATVLTASDDSLQIEITNIAESILGFANNLNPVSYVVPANENYIGPTLPSMSGIYWTGIFILAGCVVGALVLRKARR